MMIWLAHIFARKKYEYDNIGHALFERCRASYLPILQPTDTPIIYNTCPMLSLFFILQFTYYFPFQNYLNYYKIIQFSSFFHTPAIQNFSL